MLSGQQTDLNAAAEEFMRQIGLDRSRWLRTMMKILVALPNPDQFEVVLRALTQKSKLAGIGAYRSEAQSLWQSIAKYLFSRGRPYAALNLMNRLYEELLLQQSKGRVHKGVPLWWMGEFHSQLKNRALALRYWQLALCEDALNDDEPNLSFLTTGTPAKLRNEFGMTDTQIQTFIDAVRKLRHRNKKRVKFPESVLIDTNGDWPTIVPSESETLVECVNRKFLADMLKEKGAKDGKRLERIAAYLFSCVPGFRVAGKARTMSSEIDALIAVEGNFVDFRRELGCYVMVQCKEWTKPVGVEQVAAFAYQLRTANCHCGVLFASNDVGKSDGKYGIREVLKAYHANGTVMIVINQDELKQIAVGKASFLLMLRNKYEQRRLDLCNTWVDEGLATTVR